MEWARQPPEALKPAGAKGGSRPEPVLLSAASMWPAKEKHHVHFPFWEAGRQLKQGFVISGSRSAAESI